MLRPSSVPRRISSRITSPVEKMCIRDSKNKAANLKSALQLHVNAL